MYASTPPLEALRMIISFAASGEGATKRQIMICDVRRAYFYAKVTRDLYIELPDEDEHATPGQLGKLNLSLYGTRDAAKNWQEHLSRHLISIGFVRGVGHTSVFHHPQKNLMVLVHGDDYVVAGEPADQKWLKEELEKAYQIKTQILGPGGAKEGKVLNRVVAWTPKGWTYEADPRHAELIQEQLGIKSGGA